MEHTEGLPEVTEELARAEDRTPIIVNAALERGDFLEAFGNKGRLSGLLEKVPVHVLLNPGVALVGAACYGLETYGEGDIFTQIPRKGKDR